MRGVIEEPLAELACEAGLDCPALSLAAWGESGKMEEHAWVRRKGLLHPSLSLLFSTRNSTYSPLSIKI